MKYFKIFFYILLIFTYSKITIANNVLYKKEIENIINVKLNNISKMLFETRKEILKILILNEKKKLKPIYNYSIYQRGKYKSFSDHFHFARSIFYVSYKIPITKYLKNFIQMSEHFEKIFGKNKQKFPDIGWQYVVEYKYGAMRNFPWFPCDSIIGNNVRWSNFEFYKKTQANKNNNKMVAVFGGLDIGGICYVITCTVPIIFNNKHYGLIGVDLNINEFFGEIRSFLGDNLDRFSFLRYKKKNSILMQPQFYKYIIGGVFTTADLGIDKVNNTARINNIDYNVIVENLKDNYTEFQLITFKKR